MREIPDSAVNPLAPAGTPPASAAHLAPFWCSHAVRFDWDGSVGGFMVDGNAPDDELHPKDLPIVGNGALPAACQPATGFDPEEYPNAGPQAVARARAQVLRERRERGHR